jgi:hypothetical protein
MILKLEEPLRNNERPRINWVSLVAVLALTMTCFIMEACFAGTHQPTVVVYDQQWSRAAGVTALQCAPEIRDACQKEAREDEASFQNALSTAFKAAPECKDVEFIVDSGADPAKKPHYWRLRVDYRPRLNDQVFSLRAGTNAPLIGNGNANDIIKFVCKTSKNNGVVMIW